MSFPEKKNEGININSLHDLRNVSHQTYIDNMRKSNLNTINSLIRNVRKRVTQGHKNCLTRIKQDLRINDQIFYCPIAYTYLEWRYILQHFDTIRTVDNRGRSSQQIIENSIFSFINSYNPLAEEISSILTKVLNENKLLITTTHINWILNNFLICGYIHYFNYLLSYRSNSYNGELNHEDAPYLSTPILVINNITKQIKIVIPKDVILADIKKNSHTCLNLGKIKRFEISPIHKVMINMNEEWTN
ncbi:hypothetical protein AB990_13740 [Alkalihalobacillus pseudalcaliphilus]|nr:hypothetical protein AB990_13740 [Alkalihalobacillus pseudalcaliphilus]